MTARFVTPPLLAVTLVFRSRPEFDSLNLNHLVSAVSAYVDSSVEQPLHKACKFGGWGIWSVRKLLRTQKLYGKLQFSLCLLEAAKLNSVDIARWLFERFPYGVRHKVICEAVKAGALEILQFFRTNGTPIHAQEVKENGYEELDEERENWEGERYIHFDGIDATEAVLAGREDLVKWLYEQPSEMRSHHSSINAAFSIGNIELAVWIMGLVGVDPERHEALHGAATNGHVKTLQWFQDNGKYMLWDTGTLLKAAEAGHLEIVQWIIDHQIDRYKIPGCTTIAMDTAAANGHLEVVQWLHANCSEGCTTAAMDFAAESGYLETVKWLHGNRGEGCTTKAMDRAAVNGRLEVVKWLHANRSEGCTTNAMNGAAENGHLHVIKWLHEHRSEGCTSDAMDNAAGKGHFEIVKWLLENRTEGGTVAAMNDAALDGHLNIVQWLHIHGGKCTRLAIDGAARGGHLYVLRWLYENRDEEFSSDAIRNAALHAQFETLLILHQIAQQGLAKDIEVTDAKHSDTLLSKYYLEIVWNLLT
eukprot:jgi/Phyca11/96845/e_gw1.1.955.1